MSSQSINTLLDELVSVMPNDLLIKIYFDNLNIRCDEATMKKRQKLNMEFEVINNNFIEDYISYHGDDELESDLYGREEEISLVYNYINEYLEYIKYGRPNRFFIWHHYIARFDK